MSYVRKGQARPAAHRTLPARAAMKRKGASTSRSDAGRLLAETMADDISAHHAALKRKAAERRLAKANRMEAEADRMEAEYERHKAEGAPSIVGHMPVVS